MTGERYHAADDGSLARSTGGAAARGAMLIALAVVIGLVLLAFALDDPAEVIASGDDSSQTSDGSDDLDDSTTSDDGTSTDDGTGAVDDTGTTTIPTITTTTAVVSSTNPPAEVTVLVANGTGERGVAGAVSDKIAARGFVTLEPANAPSTELSVIYYRETYDGDAREIATIIGAPADVITNWPAEGTIGVASNAIEDGRLDSANVVVIIGADGRIPTG